MRGRISVISCGVSVRCGGIDCRTRTHTLHFWFARLYRASAMPMKDDDLLI